MRAIGSGTHAHAAVGMYSTCLFCHIDLGQNEVVETFPLGRRLAFDAPRGRLWVVCGHCKGWNLTPLEQRWEAIEECERLYRDARQRVSTGEIGIARLPQGLDLVRIGEPLRPELAAWRYGERLALRRRQTMVYASVGAGVAGAVIIGGAVASAALGTAALWLGAAAATRLGGSPDRILAFIPFRRRGKLVVRRKHLADARLLRNEEGYRICVPGHTMELSEEWAADLSGEAAIQAARQLLPEVNRFGGSRTSITAATQLLERWPDPRDLYRVIAEVGEPGVGTPFADLPVEMRLALEMAAHEDTERRALEGELSGLLDAWREADTIARIADDLLVPVSVREWLSRARSQPT